MGIGAIALETLAERDRRIRRERFMRSVRNLAGYFFVTLAGAGIAGTAGLVHGFNRGVSVEQKRAADAPKPTRQAPAALTQWQCTEQEFRDHADACVRRGEAVPGWFRLLKSKGKTP